MRFLNLNPFAEEVHDPETIEGKIASMQKTGGFEIKKENVILFNNT